MTVIQAIVLGIVQGLTEFLPVSSSGHLVIVPKLFGWPAPSVTFDVLLHLATLVAVCVYFARELVVLGSAFVAPRRLPAAEVKAGRRLVLWIVVATIPAGLAGVLLGDFFESLFSSTLAVGIFMILTAVLLTIADFVADRMTRVRVLSSMTLVDAVVIGLFEALAIAPGISRSGATMSSGVYLGFGRESAARFSFLISIPVILAAGLLKVGSIASGASSGDLAAYVAGALAAFLSGLAAVSLLLRFLRTHRFRVFAVYCAVVGVLVIIFSLV